MAQSEKLNKAQYETLAAFRYALRKFIHFSEAAAQAAGITPQQHQALLAIKGFPGRDQVTVSELAERLQLRHHSVVGLIDRLVTEKFVVRAPSKEDRRQVMIQLTRRGEQTLANLSTIHRTQLKRLGPELGFLLERLGGPND
ncbi:MAG TPA: MarR family transcriptional regulator [Verrucomicrobiae bacterium]|nr:MarR family transcriptional regulator [Verrucomicrobiae bacterium]